MGFIKLLSHFLQYQKKDIVAMERSSWVYHENYKVVSEYDAEEMEEYIKDVMTGYLHDGVIYDRTQVSIGPPRVIVGDFNDCLIGRIEKYEFYG